MNLIFVGKGKKGALTLKGIIEKGWRVQLCVTSPPKNSDTEWDVSVDQICSEKKIPIHATGNINSEESLMKIKSLSPDVIIVSSFTQIFKQPLLKIPSMEVVNVHSAMLPDYRGASPLNWALINGEENVGCSVIAMDEGIDTGDILSQRKISVDINDTILDLHTKINHIASDLVHEVLNDYKNDSVKRIPQKHSEGCYYHSRTFEDGLINWRTMTAIQVHNQIRALAPPYPCAFTYIGNKKLFLCRARLLDENYCGVSGRIISVQKKGMIVIAKDRGVLIERARLEEGEEQRASDFTNLRGSNLR